MYLYNGQWTETASLLESRSLHTCEHYRIDQSEVVIAVGGISAAGEILQSAEAYYLSVGTWSSMEQFPRPITFTSMVNVNYRMHMVGGIYNINLQDMVWINHPTTGWKRSQITLKDGIFNHLAFTMDKSNIHHKSNTVKLYVGIIFFVYIKLKTMLRSNNQNSSKDIKIFQLILHF